MSKSKTKDGSSPHRRTWWSSGVKTKEESVDVNKAVAELEKMIGSGEAVASKHVSVQGNPLKNLIPAAKQFAVKIQAGNNVMYREEDAKPPLFFEEMPTYVRLGMHILFTGAYQVKLLESGKLDAVMKKMSVKAGKDYDSPGSVKKIPGFVKENEIDLKDLKETDLSKYKSLNHFFFRQLKSGARPVEKPGPGTYCSAADCRLTVFESVSDATTFWIKGDQFTISTLLYGKDGKAKGPKTPPFNTNDAALAIFRLAPCDYHRFHSPMEGTIVAPPQDIDGTYFTVNPQAINTVKLDVFTANRRSVLYIRLGDKTIVAFVAIGALLVGSIQWTCKAGQKIKLGDELGYFAYGGSTVVTVFPAGTIEFDSRLTKNSKKSVETYVKVGWYLGKQSSPTAKIQSHKSSRNKQVAGRWCNNRTDGGGILG